MSSEALKGMSQDAADRLATAMIQHEEAEATKALAEAGKFTLEQENLKTNIRRNNLIIEQDQEKFDVWRAGDEFHHVYYFGDSVSEASVGRCMTALDLWDRLDPGCDITIIFNSPGGSVIDGFALFDHIQVLRRKGHKFYTVAEGMAASMAGILLQAGDVRSVGAETWILIHRAAFGAMGKTFEIEDKVEWTKRIEARILDIFVKRSNEAKENGTATQALTLAKLKKNWERKDWWLSSDESLKYGVVDEVR